MLNLDEHQLVFNLYLSWMKEGNLFYLFLIDFEVCKPKEDIRMVIRLKFKEPIVEKIPKWAWHGLKLGVGVSSPSSFLTCFEWCIGV